MAARPMYPRLSCNLFRISSSHSSVPGRVSLNNFSSRAWAWVVSVVIFISMISLRVLARWCACYRSYRIDSLPRRLPPPWVSPRPLSGIQLGEIDWVRWRRPWAHASDQSGAVVIEQCLWCLFAGRGGSLCVFFFLLRRSLFFYYTAEVRRQLEFGSKVFSWAIQQLTQQWVIFMQPILAGTQRDRNANSISSENCEWNIPVKCDLKDATSEGCWQFWRVWEGGNVGTI